MPISRMPVWLNASVRMVKIKLEPSFPLCIVEGNRFQLTLLANQYINTFRGLCFEWNSWTLLLIP